MAILNSDFYVFPKRFYSWILEFLIGFDKRQIKNCLLSFLNIKTLYRLAAMEIDML